MAKLLKREKLALAELKKELEDKLGKDLLNMILFGSKARGDSRPDSDIDVLLVVKKDTEEIRDIVNNISMDLNCKFDYKIFISCKIYSEKEYNYFKSIPTIFIQNVMYDGVIL